jgi:Na+-transporting NADH:ubiquinone oxidoreductase subunit C
MAIRDKAWYPILYMFVITLLLSAILILFGSITRQRVKDNEQILYERAVVEALPIPLPSRISPAETHKLYTSSIQNATESSAGALRYLKGDSLIAYALPVEGPGFWAIIKGVIGIDADTRTITGISFYEQNETPGLGGEIVKSEFRAQFVGKRISEADAPIEIRGASAELDESSVHAITGATQTSTRLGLFINEQLARWRELMKRER